MLNPECAIATLHTTNTIASPKKELSNHDFAALNMAAAAGGYRDNK